MLLWIVDDLLLSIRIYSCPINVFIQKLFYSISFFISLTFNRDVRSTTRIMLQNVHVVEKNKETMKRKGKMIMKNKWDNNYVIICPIISIIIDYRHNNREKLRFLGWDESIRDCVIVLFVFSIDSCFKDKFLCRIR